eukprot:973200_1
MSDLEVASEMVSLNAGSGRVEDLEAKTNTIRFKPNRCVMYIYSIWYIIASILTLAIAWWTIGLFKEQYIVLHSTLIMSSILRLAAAILSIYVTVQLTQNMIPSRKLIDIWVVILLWTPIVFDLIHITFSALTTISFNCIWYARCIHSNTTAL